MKGCFRLPWCTISRFTLARWPRMRSPAGAEAKLIVSVQTQAHDGCTTTCCMPVRLVAAVRRQEEPILEQICIEPSGGGGFISRGWRAYRAVAA